MDADQKLNETKTCFRVPFQPFVHKNESQAEIVDVIYNFS